jgi:phage replication-related protein YjqB (UPF0714/DUF867 family)
MAKLATEDEMARLDLPNNLSLPNEVLAIIDTQCLLHPAYSDADVEDRREFVERVWDTGATGLVVLAPHGGRIEQRTDDQAAHLAAALIAARVDAGLAAVNTSLWLCRGWGEDKVGAYARWHITSTDLQEASFPGLATFMARGFDHAVSFHGCGTCEWGPPGEEATPRTIIVGGRDDSGLRDDIASGIRAALGLDAASDEVVVPEVASDYAGNSERNIVNRVAEGNGIQIEQNPFARGLTDGSDRWRAVAQAVADALAVVLP